MLLLSAIFVIAGWLLSESGFESIQKIRQIERIPLTTIYSSLPGEVKLQAVAKKYKKILSSEHFKKESLYFHYRYEIEKQDSDGNDYWSTEYENIGYEDFLLDDGSGKALVSRNQLTSQNLKVSLPISEQIINGKYRYTEWRIEPDDSLFVMGMLNILADDSKQIGFIEDGQYLPIISKYSESHEKSSIGLLLILKISAGISLIAFAAFFLSNAFGIHRILAFLFILSFSVVIPLLHLGITMLYDDIVMGDQRLKLQGNNTLAAINSEITDYTSSNLDWQSVNAFLDEPRSGIPKDILQNLNEMQLNYAFGLQKFKQQLHKFPNSLIAWIYNIKPETISNNFSAEMQQRLDERLSRTQATKTQGIIPIGVIIVGGVICLLLSWIGFKLIRLKRHIENIPTSKSVGLVFGLSEIKGRVTKIDQNEPLISPLNNSKCYWYYYKVEEKQGSGKDSHWVVIDEKEDFQSFHCKDSYGEVEVFPKDAEIVTHHESVEYTGGYRYTEYVLKLNDKVYILGSAKIDRKKGDSLIIRNDSEGNPFLITNYTEQKIMLRKAVMGMLSLTGAFAALMFSSLFVLGINGSFAPVDYLSAALIAPFYMSLMIIILHYNDMIFLKRRVFRNLSNIDVCMQKRYDLMPNLEKLLKKYFSHEKELLEKLTILRNINQHNASLNEYSNQLQYSQNILHQLLAKVESNPDLKAVKLNLKLMNTLVDLENEMGLLREGYNDAVTYYNTRIETFPDVLLARIFNFSAAKLFDFPARKFSRIEVKI
jgi:hypothetical protein